MDFLSLVNRHQTKSLPTWESVYDSPKAKLLEAAELTYYLWTNQSPTASRAVLGARME